MWGCNVANRKKSVFAIFLIKIASCIAITVVQKRLYSKSFWKILFTEHKYNESIKFKQGMKDTDKNQFEDMKKILKILVKISLKFYMIQQNIILFLNTRVSF